MKSDTIILNEIIQAFREADFQELFITREEIVETVRAAIAKMQEPDLDDYDGFK